RACGGDGGIELVASVSAECDRVAARSRERHERSSAARGGHHGELYPIARGGRCGARFAEASDGQLPELRAPYGAGLVDTETAVGEQRGVSKGASRAAKVHRYDRPEVEAG